MNKEEVKQLISDKKAAAGQPFDDIAAAVDSIEVGGDAELQAKLDEAMAKLDAALAALAEDEAKLSDEMSKEAKLQAKLDAIKAALEG